MVANAGWVIFKSILWYFLKMAVAAAVADACVLMPTCVHLAPPAFCKTNLRAFLNTADLVFFAEKHRGTF